MRTDTKGESLLMLLIPLVKELQGDSILWNLQIDIPTSIPIG